MTEDDDVTDVRLRDRGERWRDGALSIPDVDDALRRARSRTRRPHVLLQVAAVAVLVLAVSVGAVVLARHTTESRPEGARPRVSAAVLAKLTRVTRVYVDDYMSGAVVTARATETTYAKAAAVFSLGVVNVIRDDQRVWVVQVRSATAACCAEPGSSLIARTMNLIVVEPGLYVAEREFDPSGTDISHLGAVIELPLDRRPSPVPASPPTPTATPTVSFAGTMGGDRFVFAVGTGPDGAAGSHLVITDSSGRSPRDIGPKAPANYEPDSVFFLDSQHGWFLAYDDATLSDQLYRTSDGGTTWQSFRAPGHNAAGGSHTTVQFQSPRQGWLTSIDANGPTEGLMRTTDGGKTWRVVGGLGAGKPGTRLPRPGLVGFTADGSRGWLGGEPSSNSPLYDTTDQGRHWHAVQEIPAGVNDIVAVPTSFGSTARTTVTRCAFGLTALSSYLSTDDGASWSHVSDQTLAHGCQQVSTASPTRSDGWAVARVGHRLAVRRTTDQGLDWSTVTGPDVTVDYAPTVTAVDADHAVVTGLGHDGTEAYATSNGGHTWHRIDRSLTHT